MIRKQPHNGGTQPRTSLITALTALGVVFGDIGTSPLYVMRAVFGIESLDLSNSNIIGVTSCIIWLLIIIVAGKYVLIVLRADHNGEGGIIALASMVSSMTRHSKRAAACFTIAGMFGASLFFGDAVITPAISVLSAVEGLSTHAPNISHFIVPIALVILLSFFFSQKFGTEAVGKFFGPIMAIWFGVLIVLGIPHILHTPRILLALNPWEAIHFIINNPMIAFLAIGAIVLAVTGAEALYADIAHFGRHAIQSAWFALVLPSLTIVYLGQGALLINTPSALSHPFYFLAPHWAVVPLLILATLATLIASQAVITGAYSIAVQASRLGYLPHLRIVYTTERNSGQIYLPTINTLLCIAVVAVIVIFRNSDQLAGAYGIAVTTDFLLTSTLLTLYFHYKKTTRTWIVALMMLFFYALELPLWAANLTKITSGGWLPLGVAVLLFVVMRIWHHGEARIVSLRKNLEPPIDDFITSLVKNPPRRIPGTAIYLHSMNSTTPIPMKRNVDITHTLHDRVVILSVKTMRIPHTDEESRAEIVQVSPDLPGVYHVLLRYGFKDFRRPLYDLAHSQVAAVRNWNFERAIVFSSHLTFEADSSRKLWPWTRLARCVFLYLARMSASPTWLREIPARQFIEISLRVDV